MGYRFTATALIEEHNAVGAGIENTTVIGPSAGARTPMNEQRRLTVRVAGLLKIDFVAVGNLQHALVVGLDLGIEGA